MNDEPKRIKQVIVMRHDLKMRRGKQMAQAAHASMSFICRRLQERGSVSLADFSEVERAWLTGAFAKVGEQTLDGRCLPPLRHVFTPDEIIRGQLPLGRQLFQLCRPDRAVLLAALCVMPVRCHAFVLRVVCCGRRSGEFGFESRNPLIESGKLIVDRLVGLIVDLRMVIEDVQSEEGGDEKSRNHCHDCK